MINMKAKIWKTGTGYVVTVPKKLVDLGIVNEGKEYEFEIKDAVFGNTTRDFGFFLNAADVGV